jgi:DNA polymerase elongation subunit (family B)
MELLYGTKLTGGSMKKKGSTPPTVRKYTGVCGYNSKSEDVIRIERAIERSDNEVLIGYSFDGVDYSVLLERVKDNAYKGAWTSRRGGDSETGPATCRLFPFGEGRLLFGSWQENGADHYWWAKLETVTRFPDEKK